MIMTKIQEQQKHFLALLYRPGDYALIDISKLDIANGRNPQTLQEIDDFTKNYTSEELLAAIIRTNIVSRTYGELVIQDNQKHNPISVLDKKIYDDFKIDEFLDNHATDKNTLNTILNKFRSINDDKELNDRFGTALLENDLLESLNILFALPYLKLRKMMFYIIEIANKEKAKEKQKELIREKAA